MIPGYKSYKISVTLRAVWFILSLNTIFSWFGACIYYIRRCDIYPYMHIFSQMQLFLLHTHTQHTWNPRYLSYPLLHIIHAKISTSPIKIHWIRNTDIDKNSESEDKNSEKTYLMLTSFNITLLNDISTLHISWSLLSCSNQCTNIQFYSVFLKNKREIEREKSKKLYKTKVFNTEYKEHS